MIDKKVNSEEQVQRMKNLMTYGLKENKQPAYSSVEYSKEAADGKLYGIVREGAKYYIKVAKNPKGNLVNENFDYIGGFRNRKDNAFDSFASAQRYFVEKMICINESVDDARKRVIAESWDLDAKKEVVEEGTKKMQAEIARQREIMKNAQNINEGKSCDMAGGCPKTETMKTEEPKSQPGAPFTVTLKNSDIKDTQDDNIKGKKEPMTGNKKATNESTETPLVSRKNPEFMDKSHGTELGKTDPFVYDVEGEETETPDGEEKEYEVEVVSEAIEDLSDEIEDDELESDVDLEDTDDVEDDTDIEDDAEADEDADVEVDTEVDADADANDDDEVEVDTEVETESDEDDVKARLETLEEKVNQILDAINSMKYDDDEELYDDDDDETEYEVDVESEPEDDGFDEEDEDVEVVESKSYRAMRLKEEADFGKHPAYQKVVMTTPPNNMPFEEGQYDMNDESADNEEPYGTSKGNQDPYEETPEHIEDAITEAVMRRLKKKLV